MTDKQIVVDGVDISECEHVFARTSSFKEKNFVECTAFFLENEDSRCNCSDNPNCYYKQLKRKERECEESKSVRDMWMSKCEQEIKAGEFFQDRFDDLKRALIEIKEALQFYNNITIGTYKGGGVFEFEVCNENVGKLIYCYDTNPAKQALQKIDEVISE